MLKKGLTFPSILNFVTLPTKPTMTTNFEEEKAIEKKLRQEYNEEIEKQKKIKILPTVPGKRVAK
ncbi:MAG: hypothetical protein Q8Q23_03865 [bacterium]|nr:hypothetical protein [bacterium]